MTPRYKEASFPADYRRAEVEQILSAIYKLRSIAINGLAGMGKSNVVRFIVSHPQVRSQYLKDRADDFAFVHVDCAGLAHGHEDEILDEIAAQLRYDGIVPDELPRPANNPRRVLKEHILNADPDLNLVLVLDYFDQAAADLDRSFFNFLFHLRNSRPRGNLSYVFATRRPMGHLYELRELLDESCVIGPLNYNDALESIKRDEERLGITFDASQREGLIALSGGHPGLLKNASELLASKTFDVSLSKEKVARRLLEFEKVTNLCEELWEDLTQAEQGLLLKVTKGISVSKSKGDTDGAYLLRTGILVQRNEERARFGIFCPLFENFVREITLDSVGTVRIRAVFPNRAQIETPTQEEQITLSPKLFALLMALAEAQGQTLPVDHLIACVYGHDAVGVSNAALSQLVKRLRAALDPHVQRMTNDPTYTSVETVRDVGYKLTTED